MNKTAIKNFAVWARVQLIEAAKQRAFEYEITENGENKTGIDTIGGRPLTTDEKKQRELLIDEIRRKGYSQVMEEAAYTWFNRFIALRYMEVNGYLPSKVRVFTDETGTFKPEILKQAMSVEIEGLDRSRVLELLDKQNNEELYKYLLITQCNALNQGLPYMFEKISNWTELLFPQNLLRADNVIGRMIADIPEEDWLNEIEVIGWLYQYYISEKHEEVIDPLHGKIIKKEDIPAATQLFTTDWVVRYILDNSLGRYWIERHPESKLAEKLTYLVIPKNGALETVEESISPEELKVFDPCVGSGHFLSYAFDVLLEIYRECGWSDRDASKSILENNLYGLDIDDRAAQLACFAVAMKARKYNRRILNGEVELHILAMQDSDFITEDFTRYFANSDDTLRKAIDELRIVFNNAKEYGSTICVPKLDYAALYERIDIIRRSFADDIFQIEYQRIAHELLLPLVKQAEILSKKYDIVATNPPYMNKFSPRLKDYIQQHFAAYKGDLFSVFMFRNFAFCKENGYSGFMTPMVWMFIKTYEELRKYIISQKSIATLIQFEYSAFEEATVPICSFVLKNGKPKDNALCFRLSTFTGGMEVQKQKVLEALSNKNCGYFHEADQSNFSKIPGSPIAYWLSNNFIKLLGQRETIGKVHEAGSGLSTADNERFLRFFWEVDREKIAQGKGDCKKWYLFHKGGEYRKWYGNLFYVVNWENDGAEIKYWVTHNPKDPNTTSWSRRIFNTHLYFERGITWSVISSGDTSFRAIDTDAMISNAAGGIFGFADVGQRDSFMAAINSKVWTKLFATINPTINYSSGVIQKAPLPVLVDNKLGSECVSISKKDWDSFETSWDFKKHPLL